MNILAEFSSSPWRITIGETRDVIRVKAYTFGINDSSTPGDFRKKEIRFRQRGDQATLAAYLEELLQNAEKIGFAGSVQHEVVDPSLEVLLQLGEALLDLLLEVRCGVASTLSSTCRHDNAIRRGKCEERLAVHMQWCLPVPAAEINTGEGL